MTTFARFGVGRNVKIDQFNFPNRNYPANYTGVWDRSIDVDLAAFNACKTSKSSVFGLNTSLTANARNSQTVRVGVDTTDLTVGQPIYRIRFALKAC